MSLTLANPNTIKKKKRINTIVKYLLSGRYWLDFFTKQFSYLLLTITSKTENNFPRIPLLASDRENKDYFIQNL